LYGDTEKTSLTSLVGFIKGSKISTPLNSFTVFTILFIESFMEAPSVLAKADK
jgi:hypothetical protein